MCQSVKTHLKQCVNLKLQFLSFKTKLQTFKLSVFCLNVVSVP